MSCSATVSSSAAANALLGSAPAGGVICLSAGSYPGIHLAGAHAGDVTVQPVPGQAVTITAGLTDSHGQPVAVYAEPGTSHVVVHGFHILGMVELERGGSFIRIDHNDITGGDFGVELDSTDCTVPNAPTWSGCQPEPKITDVTISGNRIHNIGGGSGDDSINMNNFARVRITGNELFGMVESGNHTDCLQATFGGSGLVFDRNYEHDNNCQGFFVKDGDVTDTILYDNLFLRDQAAHQQEANLDIVNVYNLVIRNNTSWPDTGDILRDFGSAQQPHAAVDHNVMDMFANGCCNDGSYFKLTEGYNIFWHGSSGFPRSQTDWVGAPAFVAPASDDYRLTSNPSGIGVDWRPADQHYGP